MAGIVTIEDVIERLIKEDIEDETDHGTRLDLRTATQLKHLKEQGGTKFSRLNTKPQPEGIKLKIMNTPTPDNEGLKDTLHHKTTDSKKNPSQLALGLASRWADTIRKKTWRFNK